ncbi:Yop protein translocation protein Q [compost metagenome]
MKALNLPSADSALLATQRQLSKCRCHYPFATGQAMLSLAPRPASLDCTLNAQWRGLPLDLQCNTALLALWLTSALQEAAFSNLPQALQLTLVQREAALLPGLICTSLTPTRPAASDYGLCLTLSADDRQLPLWIDGDIPSLLRQLPAKPLSEWLPLPLQLSLQWPAVVLPMAQLRTLACGDLLLFAPNTQVDGRALGYLQGRAWAELTLIDTELEIITMLDTPVSDSDFDLTDLEQLPVQVGFEIGRHTLDLHTLATLQPGSLIDLAAPLNGEVRILANQRCIGTGELVSLQDRLGVRVLRLLQGNPA